MSELRRFILVRLSVVMSCGISIYAQELKCDVEINSEQIQNSSKEVFTTLKQAIADYMNTNKWTDAQFSANEKIECKMYLTIKSYKSSTYIFLNLLTLIDFCLLLSIYLTY